MSDKLDLKKHIRNVDDFPIPGIKFRDITSLIENPEPFRKTCEELTKITKEFSADLVVSIESRGFIFAGSVARDSQMIQQFETLGENQMRIAKNIDSQEVTNSVLNTKRFIQDRLTTGGY